MLAQHRDVCLNVDLSGEGFLEIDTARIEQAVLVLVDNASKYSPPGGCITLRSRVKDQALVIEVADQGPGISADDIPFIFDRFHRVGMRRARKKDGTGLGLSIARTIIETHSGTISVASRVGEGTTMTIRLPLCDPAAPVESPLWRFVTGGTLAGTSHSTLLYRIWVRSIPIPGLSSRDLTSLMHNDRRPSIVVRSVWRTCGIS